MPSTKDIQIKAKYAKNRLKEQVDGPVWLFGPCLEP
jgi:hypothetical protein